MEMQLALGLIGGLLVGLFVATVFYAVKWNEEHEKAVAAEMEVQALTTQIMELERAVHPHAWVEADDTEQFLAGQLAQYDRHPELLKPGTEIIRITDDDDVPEWAPNDGRSL